MGNIINNILFAPTRTAGQKAAAVFYPERCAACGKVVHCGSLVCEKCVPEIRIIDGQAACDGCGLAKNECECKGKGYLYIDNVAGCFYYENAAKSAILRLKLSGKLYAAELLYISMANIAARRYAGEPVDIIVSVPVFHDTQRKRGFNQSELLARGISKLLGIPHAAVLKKIYPTPPQRSLPADRRSGNVLGVFDTDEKIDISGKTVLLVDDVCTTGATMDECAKVLKLYGSGKVLGIAAALVRKEHS